MTFQEIFDKVYTGLRDQGFKQSFSGNSCLYRSDVGKCAAGFLIPDENYKDDFEFKSADDVPFIADNFSRDDLDFILDVQRVHDGLPIYENNWLDPSPLFDRVDIGSLSPNDMFQRLTYFAWKHMLSIPA